MTERRFFYVFAGVRGEPTFQIFHHDRPTKYTLRELPPLLHQRELAGEQLSWSLEALRQEYLRSGPPPVTDVPLQAKKGAAPSRLD